MFIAHMHTKDTTEKSTKHKYNIIEMSRTATASVRQCDQHQQHQHQAMTQRKMHADLKSLFINEHNTWAYYYFICFHCLFVDFFVCVCLYEYAIAGRIVLVCIVLLELALRSIIIRIFVKSLLTHTRLSAGWWNAVIFLYCIIFFIFIF